MPASEPDVPALLEDANRQLEDAVRSLTLRDRRHLFRAIRADGLRDTVLPSAAMTCGELATALFMVRERRKRDHRSKACPRQ